MPPQVDAFKIGDDVATFCAWPFTCERYGFSVVSERNLYLLAGHECSEVTIGNL